MVIVPNSSKTPLNPALPLFCKRQKQLYNLKNEITLTLEHLSEPADSLEKLRI